MSAAFSPPLPRSRADRAAAAVEITAAFVAEALNEGDYAVLADFAHPDIGDLSDPRIFPDGLGGLRSTIIAARARMPDLFARIKDIRPGEVGSVRVELEVTGTYLGDPMAPTGREGRTARWTQHHLWFFRAGRAGSHLGRVDRAAVERCLGPRF